MVGVCDGMGWGCDSAEVSVVIATGSSSADSGTAAKRQARGAKAERERERARGEPRPIGLSAEAPPTTSLQISCERDEGEDYLINLFPIRGHVCTSCHGQAKACRCPEACAIQESSNTNSCERYRKENPAETETLTGIWPEGKNQREGLVWRSSKYQQRPRRPRSNSHWVL